MLSQAFLMSCICTFLWVTTGCFRVHFGTVELGFGALNSDRFSNVHQFLTGVAIFSGSAADQLAQDQALLKRFTAVSTCIESL